MSLDGAPQSYPNPPIHEALVEFRFKPSADWDLTIPGKLHQHHAMASVYRGKPRNQNVMMPVSIAGAAGASAFALQQGIGRIQLVDEQGTRHVALAQDVISVHVLRPYEGWTNFRPRIEAGLRAYSEVTGSTDVIRIGVRYVNRIEISGRTLDLRRFLRDGPRPPEGIPQEFSTFLSRVEYRYEDHCKLILTQTSVDEPSDEKSAFILDIDVIWDGVADKTLGESLTVDAALALMDTLHDREKIAFEALITDETRSLFNAL